MTDELGQSPQTVSTLCARRAQLLNRLGVFANRARHPRPFSVEGRLTRMVGLTLESAGCVAAIGDRCEISRGSGRPIEVEVVGFRGDRLLLMPIGDVRGLAPNASVKAIGRSGRMRFGAGLLGRVLNGQGLPIDGGGPLLNTERLPIDRVPLNPMQRRPVSTPFDVGVRSINALLTLGEGQRVGLFAGSGVGKSVLLGMMTKFSAADVVVVGLIGERGREVGDFVHQTLGPDGLDRAVVVAAPADDPPLLRLLGAELATQIAERFRDEGKRVLLLIDSLTRYAQAQREIGLAIGEPPTSRGYPPSVFAKLPQLAERAGNAANGGGSITAIYTVLTESEETIDPVADAARAILDGHIVLSRSLAERNHYPAVDVEASISRVFPQITEPGHRADVERFRQLLSVYQQHEDLISVGAYTAGANRNIDLAIEAYPRLMRFLEQSADTCEPSDASVATLSRLIGGMGGEVDVDAA
ncbi:MAG: FliI/YscN family ATPase [Pseudomonadota bacterium]